MQQHTNAYITRLEKEVGSIDDVLRGIRAMSLDEFGEILSILPDDRFPRLSEYLPHQTPADVQLNWTGASGDKLLAQSVLIANSLAAGYTIESGRGLGDAKVLDFGCGWGRLLRLLMYFTNPDNLYGCDAWESSLQHASAARVKAHLARSDVAPNELPFAGVKFDLIYAFSIFTHLPESLALTCLSAIRKAISDDGLLFLTVRPVEYWLEAIHPAFGKPDPAPLVRAHDQAGFAFLPLPESDGSWGDASITRAYLDGLPGWKVVRFGRALIDPYQLFVWLRPA